MAVFARPRQAFVIAGVLGLALSATACGTGDDKKSSNADSAECAAYEKYQGHDGKKVTIYASIRDAEADLLEQSWKQFENCTGIKIDYEGSGEFEAQLQVRVDGGNAPDLAFIPQPGLVKRFADARQAQGRSAPTPRPLAEQNCSADWLKYGTVDGKLYGAPLGSNVKSLRLVLAEDLQGEGLDGPDHLGRADHAQRHDRGERHQAVVRRHRVR